MNRQIVIIITAVSSVIFLVVLISSTLYSPNGEVSLVSSKVEIVNPSEIELMDVPNLTKIKEPEEKIKGIPERIFIPQLNVDAEIKEVGITKNGNIASPRSFSDAGWYKYGPLPGQAGTAVIDGHVDNGLAFPGVFKNLDKLKMGDSIYIETNNDKTLRFVVDQIDIYDYQAKTPFKETGDPKLILITCTGDFQPEARTHNRRLVVTAVPVDDFTKN